MSTSKSFGKGFNQLHATDHIKKLILKKSGSNDTISLDNLPGKKASVKILFNIAQHNQATITAHEAKTGLELFGDYTEEERQQPNSHPNIRLLINIIKNNESWTVNLE